MLVKKIWYDENNGPPQTGEWDWAKTKGDAQAMLAANWNNDDIDVVFDGGNGAEDILEQMSVLARFHAVVKPIWFRYHGDNVEIAEKLIAEIKRFFNG